MKIKTTELLHTSQSWDGAELPDYPLGRPELKAFRTVFPVGAKTGWHHHNVINYGIIEQGELTIVCENGTEKTFRAGETIAEVVGTIHRGENRGQEPIILDMFYISKEGTEVTTQDPDFRKEKTSHKPAKEHKRPVPNSKEEERVFKLVRAIGKQKLPRKQIMADLGLQQKSRKSIIDNYFRPAYLNGYINFAYPAVPNKPGQAYRLTAKGLELYAQLTGETE